MAELNTTLNTAKINVRAITVRLRALEPEELDRAKEIMDQHKDDPLKALAYIQAEFGE